MDGQYYVSHLLHLQGNLVKVSETSLTFTTCLLTFDMLSDRTTMECQSKMATTFKMIR